MEELQVIQMGEITTEQFSINLLRRLAIAAPSLRVATCTFQLIEGKTDLDWSVKAAVDESWEVCYQGSYLPIESDTVRKEFKTAKEKAIASFGATSWMKLTFMDVARWIGFDTPFEYTLTYCSMGVVGTRKVRSDCLCEFSEQWSRCSYPPPCS